MRICLTAHAIKRARQRLRWSERTLHRMMERVFCFGLPSEATTGKLRRYLDSKTEDDASMTRIYGDHLFVFGVGEEPGLFHLLTVFRLPGPLCDRAHQAFREAVSAA